MPSHSLADRIGELLVLTPTEQRVLERLGERERIVKRGTTLVRENDRSTELFVLKRGMMMAYVLLHDGSRQVLRFLYPGDTIGMSVIAYGKAPDTLVALADSTVAAIDRVQLAQLVYRHPRLAMAFAAMGRTPARSRIAAVLLDIRDRQRRCDPAIAKTFNLGLTQEEIGDATGLTAVHVNRMLRQLEEQGLIARSGTRVTMLDEQALVRFANHVDRFSGIDLSWLPPEGEAGSG